MGMRIRFCTAVALAGFAILWIPAKAIAQQQALGYGYAFAGPAAVSHIGSQSIAVNAGGGGELWLGGGISLGGELGLLNFPAVERPCCLDSASSANGLLLSANASRHFGVSGRETRWRPFITGGLSVVAGGGAIGLFNAGGGAERWISPHAGIRIEVRDQFGLAANPSVLLGFRIGLVFR